MREARGWRRKRMNQQGRNKSSRVWEEERERASGKARRRGGGGEKFTEAE